jgi:hypothetical protein
MCLYDPTYKANKAKANTDVANDKKKTQALAEVNNKDGIDVDVICGYETKLAPDGAILVKYGTSYGVIDGLPIPITEKLSIKSHWAEIKKIREEESRIKLEKLAKAEAEKKAAAEKAALLEAEKIKKSKEANPAKTPYKPKTNTGKTTESKVVEYAKNANKALNKTADFVANDLHVKDADAPLLGIGIALDKTGGKLTKKYTDPLKKGQYPGADGKVKSADNMSNRAPKRQSAAYKKALQMDKLAKVLDILGKTLGVVQIVSDLDQWKKGKMSDTHFYFKALLFVGSLTPAGRGAKTVLMLLDILDTFILDDDKTFEKLEDGAVDMWNDLWD